MANGKSLLVHFRYISDKISKISLLRESLERNCAGNVYTHHFTSHMVQGLGWDLPAHILVLFSAYRPCTYMTRYKLLSFPVQNTHLLFIVLDQTQSLECNVWYDDVSKSSGRCFI
ncbi:hypothetical protein PAXRUDRAFT_508205 [Paxillus rubicundulus Ve08.2h10]|uniref:Uncharacterized protein n=1 Tax=Paxillus rubicundulus Ve08.2h10 TaxID=930991 RepID=A0A0D0D972_9AGAM|nr:hypothetical protein PAXRUDRAFT_508205 [Paxillus rubicundulus Ve08.2h10]